MGSSPKAAAAWVTSSSPIVFWRLLQTLLGAAGVGAILFALLHPHFRDAEGFLQGSFAFALSLGAALLIAAASCTSAWRSFGFWLALSVAGQAACLQWIDAGRTVHYQHYRWPAASNGNHAVAALLLVVQTLAVAASLYKHRRALGAWIRTLFRPWALGVILAGWVLTSAALSRKPADYAIEVAWAGFLQALQLASIVLVVWRIPPTGLARLTPALDRFLGETPASAIGQRRFLWGAALWVIVLAASLSYFVYENHPHLADEVAYLYQARYLAAGKLTLDPPPAPEAMTVYLMEQQNGRWYAATPPGWPAVLAVGVLLGIPWLVNPVLGGVNVMLAYAIMRELLGQAPARLGTLLLATSPWFLFMCMNFMTHTLTMTCALVGAWGVLRCRRSANPAWALVAGIAIGAASLIRPLDGLLVAVLLGLWSLGLGGSRLPWKGLAALAIGTALSGAVVLLYNHQLTGSPTTFPLSAYADRYFGPGRNSLGFGPQKGLPFGGLDPAPGHGLFDALVNAQLNLSAINVELFGWGAGSLLVILAPLLARPPGRLERTLLAAITMVVGTFSLYWFSGGPDFGARYWYLVLLPLIILAVQGVRLLQAKLDTAAEKTRVLAATLLLAAMTVINYLPWRAIDKYFHYLHMRPDVRRLAAGGDFRNSLVFVRGPEFPDYASAWIHNPIRWDTDAPLYAALKSPAQIAALLRTYPGRRLWVLEGPTITGAGYRLAGSPTAEQLLAADQLDY